MGHTENSGEGDKRFSHTSQQDASGQLEGRLVQGAHSLTGIAIAPLRSL